MGTVETMKRRAELKVFFFGDSICFGQGVSPHKGWVTRIAAGLDELGAQFGAPIVVQNPSINGDTTRQALERMAYDVQAHEPDILLIQFGMNDCNHWATDRGGPRVSAKAFAANLEEIVERGRRFGARRVFLLTNHPSGRHGPMLERGFSYESSNKRYNEVIRQVAESLDHSVELIDMEKAFDTQFKASGMSPASILLADELHLGPDGHEIYFQTVWPLVRDAVRAMLAAGRASALEHR